MDARRRAGISSAYPKGSYSSEPSEKCVPSNKFIESCTVPKLLSKLSAEFVNNGLEWVPKFSKYCKNQGILKEV